MALGTVLHDLLTRALGGGLTLAAFWTFDTQIFCHVHDCICLCKYNQQVLMILVSRWCYIPIDFGSSF